MANNRLLYYFLFTHIVIWTLIPSITNQNLPLDTIEALAWGSNLDWGFNKHPPLSALAVETIYQIFGKQDWAYYFLSQLFVAVAFYYVFKLSKEILNTEKNALLSVMLLEGIFFYNFTTPEFNVNVCELPFWSIAGYYGYKCLKEDQVKDYIILGIVSALGFLSKYLFVYLLIGIKIFYLFYIKKNKLKFNYFIPGVVFLIILIPHFIWLAENNFITITYGLKRTGEAKHYLDHIILPFTFLAKQIGILIPFFVLLYILIKKIKTNFSLKDQNILYLLSITIVPIFFVFLTSLILGAKIKTMWMTPFYLFIGTLSIYLFQNSLNLNNLKKFYICFSFLFLLSPALYGYISIIKDNKRTDYPGNEIANKIQKYWNTKCKKQIKFVKGDEWFAGNLSYHLKSRPKWSFDNSSNEIKIGICDNGQYISINKSELK